MSTPKNHHYVSQVHLKNFFNTKDGEIYIYDKSRKNLYSKKSTKSVFSEKFGNSRYINGKLDHKSLEDDLNEHFEKDFPTHYNTINSFIENRTWNKEVKDALVYIAKYGIIADFRTPRYKQNFEDNFFSAFQQISQSAIPELKKEIDQMFDYKDQVQYMNVVDYSNIANKILDLMGDLIFSIQVPRDEKDYFLIPDIAGATSREKINQYFNPEIKEIAYIGIPLSSKIYIHYYSEKLFTKEKKPTSSLVFIDSEEVNFINKKNYDYSQNKVACENKVFLEDFIRKN
ncbi:uncharacterized protein DUF4238 [Christiangramia gaetbulicola]|uniref:Uncharacterized protein DUF4238 n=1 Tax=Christiangramia gaetbulicola TaxID=703340 RepID=A0A2T6AI34_9FLAO|nr:DUF4238 domain-containing protein [Christiangramia gaetbulicola]PTX43461.1 uncharacterized protein DUF4238 [Christiangramia gaetbulicola]